MSLQRKITVLLVIFVVLSLAIWISPVLAAENEDENEELEWRLQLIEASREMMEEEEEVDLHFQRIATVITTFPDDGSAVNGGLSITPHLTGLAEDRAALRGRAELLYLRGDGEFAGFLSLILAPWENIYFGIGGEIIGVADYQAFVGWEPTDNFFLEIRAVNTGGDIEDSEIHPAAGFQMKF